MGCIPLVTSRRRAAERAPVPLILAAAFLLVLVDTSCAGRPLVGSPKSASPTPTATATPTPSPPHVFVIVMENSSLSAALQAPYVASLSRQYALLTNYHPVGKPSLPNYLALTSGSTWGVQDDRYHQLPAEDIGHQLTAAGKSWRAYMEQMTGDCFYSPYPYALKHNPFAYYGGGCPSNVVPFTQLASDLAGDTPQYNWITPNLCHDGHDCTFNQSDDWLRATVPTILASQAWRSGGVLFLLWDESDTGGNDAIPAIVISPSLRAHSSSQYYDHYSTLATSEDMLGVPRLGAAQQASPITDVLRT